MTPKISVLSAGEMVHLLKALGTLPKDLGSVPSTHLAAYNCL